MELAAFKDYFACDMLESFSCVILEISERRIGRILFECLLIRHFSDLPLYLMSPVIC